MYTWVLTPGCTCIVAIPARIHSSTLGNPQTLDLEDGYFKLSYPTAYSPLPKRVAVKGRGHGCIQTVFCRDP